MNGGRFVVLGLGNAILSDDGAGIHALGKLRSSGVPRGVALVDGGTAGAGLLDAVAGCEGLLVLDAVDVGGEPGDVVRINLEGGVGRPGPRTVHELGLETLLQDLRLLETFPSRAVLFGIQPEALGPGTGLSPPVAGSLDTMVAAALDELREWAQQASGKTVTRNAGVNASTENEL